MGTKLKAPPVFEEDSDYMAWKNDIEVWRIYTDLEKKKQGPAVYLSLSGRAREAVRNIRPADLAKDDGLPMILERLDTLFLKDKSTRAYNAFKEFYSYKRKPTDMYSDFIIQFEKLYDKVVQYEMALPEAVRAYFLLNAANMTEDNEKLARTTCGDLTYHNMKDKIMKIFGDVAGNDKEFLPVKEECLVGYNNSFRRGRSSYRPYQSLNRRGASKGKFSAERRDYEFNPVDKDGNYLKCHICQSIKHFANRCPNKRSPEDRGEDNDGDEKSAINQIHITFMTTAKEFCFIGEVFSKGILDSGCTKTVSGRTWMEEYVSVLPEKYRTQVKRSSTYSSFQFGDGKECISRENVVIPVLVGGNVYKISVAVVDNQIPLLISRKTMKSLGMKLNFLTDAIEMGKKEIKLHISSSGHYCLPLTAWDLDTTDNEIILHTVELSKLTREEKMKKATKLHRQFAHASKEKLIKLVKNSNLCTDEEFFRCLEECCTTCSTCLMYKRPHYKPIVSLPIADRFNQVVCMDLKEYIHNKSWILHLIDASARYSVACLISTKHREVVLQKIFRFWIAYFGIPHKFLSDNGGEFDNDEMRDLGDKFGIEIRTTAAESPFSNGIVERHNAVIYESMMKTIDDCNCDPEVALSYAVSAKNALQNNNGFSPNQLVFGQNFNLPTVLHDDLPALETATESLIVMKNLVALHAARKNFIAAESSERIKRALTHQVRTYSDEVYENGEAVFYRRKGFKGWKGPATVLGRDGQYVLLRHGGGNFRVHPSHLMKKDRNREMDKREETETTRRTNEKSTQTTVIPPDVTSSSLGRSDWVLPPVHVKEKANQSANMSDDDVDEEETTEVINDRRRDEVETTEVSDQSGDQFQTASTPLSHSRVPLSGETVSDTAIDEVTERFSMLPLPSKDSNVKPRANTHVEFQLGEGACKARVLSKQPKRTGKNRDWVNIIKEGEAEPSSVDWSKVTKWREIEAPEETVYLCSIDEASQEVIDAKAKELENLNFHDVFDEVDNDGQSYISTKWVITEKHQNGCKKTKARLVARGFEEDSKLLRTDSPTCSKQNFRIVMAIGASKSWTVHSLDISSAFLQGDVMKREVYVKPPADLASKEKLWKLKRCLYGLNDAPRAWYTRVRDVFLKLGALVSAYDQALFMWHRDGKLIGVLVCHVDDFTYCGTQVFHREVINKLKTTFKISSEDSSCFKYLGLQVIQNDKGITVKQDRYIESVSNVKVDRNKSNSTLLNDKEKSELRSISGQVAWVVGQTRPDLAFESCALANVGKSPTIEDLKLASKTVKKMKEKDISLNIPRLNDIENAHLLCFPDATHASLRCGSSQGAFIIFLSDGKNVVPLTWQSKKLSRVTKSPLASETMILGEGADMCYLLASTLQEIFLLRERPRVFCFTDCQSLNNTIKTSNVTKDIRLRVDVARLRQMVERDEICVNWIDGDDQIADCMTKRGASSNKLLDVLESSTISIRH